jgi:polar amino acid transport system substrate-binding protein
MGQLVFTQPYYATPESFYITTDAPYTSPRQLSGKRIGVCTGCFADLYLQKKLEVPGEPVKFLVDDAEIVRYEFEPVGLRDVGRGDLDAFLCQNTAGDEAIKQGIPLRTLGDPAYYAYLSGALDRSSDLDQAAFIARVNQIVQGLLADGTLRSLSERFFGTDYTSQAASFDITSIDQPPQ